MTVRSDRYNLSVLRYTDQYKIYARALQLNKHAKRVDVIMRIVSLRVITYVVTLNKRQLAWYAPVNNNVKQAHS